MHNYAGNPANFPANIGVLDDSDLTLPTATTLNVAPQGIADRTAYLRNGWAGPGLNWTRRLSPALALGSADVCYAGRPAWDPLSSRWLLSVSDSLSGQSTVIAGYGLDEDVSSGWANVATGFLETGGQVPVGLSCDAATAGKYWAACFSTSVNPNDTLTIRTVANPASGWTTSRGPITPGSGAVYVDCPMIAFNGVVIYAAISASAAAATISSSNGSAWTDNVTGAAFGLSPTGGLLKSNGAQVLCCATGQGNGPTLYATADGVTWTTTTLAFVGLNDLIAGLAWHTAAGLWIMAVQTAVLTSPASTAFYSSPDGVTWTKIGSGGPHKLLIADLAYVKGQLVCTLADASSAGPSGQIRSPDGGVTWYFQQAGFALNLASSSPYYARSQIAEAPIGLCAWNALGFRLSDLAGDPPVALT